MGRRGKVFSEEEQQLYLALHDQTRLERERAFQRDKDRRGDSWPVAQARAPRSAPRRTLIGFRSTKAGRAPGRGGLTPRGLGACPPLPGARRVTVPCVRRPSHRRPWLVFCCGITPRRRVGSLPTHRGPVGAGGPSHMPRRNSDGEDHRRRHRRETDRLGRGHGLRPSRRRHQRDLRGAAQEPGEDPLHPVPPRGGGGLRRLRLRQVHRAAGRLLRDERPRGDPPAQRPLRRQARPRPGAGHHRAYLSRP